MARNPAPAVLVKEPRIAYCGGTFDLLHPGHINLLRRAKQEFDIVVVSLNTDEFTSSYKRRHRKPMMPLLDRMVMASACRYVDQVIVNTGGPDSKPAILQSGAKFIVHGSDWTGTKLMKQMGLTKQWLAEQGITMVYYPYTHGVSTTHLRRKRAL